MGILLALIGSLGFALMNVLIRKGVRPGELDNGVLTTLFVSVGIFSALLGTLAVAVGVNHWDPQGLGWFVLAGFCSTFLGRETLFAAIRHIGAARAVALKSSAPLVTVAIAVAFIGERLTPSAVAGMLIVVLGLLALVHASVRTTGNQVDARSDLFAGTDPREAALVGAGSYVGVCDRECSAAVRSITTSHELRLRGLVLAVLAALSFGSAHAFRKVGMDLWPDAVMGAALGSWTALVAFLVTAAVRGQLSRSIRSALTGVSPHFWAAGVAGTIGQLSFFAALTLAPVSSVSVVAAAESVFTVALAVVLVGRAEAISRWIVLSIIAMFLGAGLLAVG